MNSSSKISCVNPFQFERLWATVLVSAIGSVMCHAQTCPFDDGNSQLTREGVVLTRFALGITGPAMVNGTDFIAADAPTIASNIACPSCGLNITGNVDGGGNPVVTPVDATIISRKLAGFSGSALTNGVALGSGSRNTPAAVNSFLLSGCGTTPSNAWVNGGNAFGAAAVIGTTDAHQMEVRSGGNAVKLLVNGENGVRVIQTSNLDAPAVIAGSSRNSTGLTPRIGATVAGGGSDSTGGLSCNDPPLNSTRSCGNVGIADWATIGGGLGNRVTGTAATVAGGRSNTAVNGRDTVSGGDQNTASGEISTVPGGILNRALGFASFAAGIGATARGQANFVWSDFATGYQPFDPAVIGSFGATPSNVIPLNNTFIVRATGGVQFITGVNNIGSITSQCFIAPGGSGWNCLSDRNAKRSVRTVASKRVLHALLSLPISTWALEGNPRRQIGPMSQDFFAAFRGLGVGDDERSINSVDAQGVAFAAIQGLHKIVKEKDAEIMRLRRDQIASDAALQAMKAEVAAIKKRLGM